MQEGWFKHVPSIQIVRYSRCATAQTSWPCCQNASCTHTHTYSKHGCNMRALSWSQLVVERSQPDCFNMCLENKSLFDRVAKTCLSHFVSFWSRKVNDLLWFWLLFILQLANDAKEPKRILNGIPSSFQLLPYLPSFTKVSSGPTKIVETSRSTDGFQRNHWNLSALARRSAPKTSCVNS